MEKWKEKLKEQRDKVTSLGDKAASLGDKAASFKDKATSLKDKAAPLREKYFEGEVTVPKTELWLVLISCFLMGLLYGLKKASRAHGFMLGCNNGNSFGCCRNRKRSAKAEKAEEENLNSGKEACGHKKSDKRHKCHKKSRCCCKNR